jgi:putative lipoic acid-binding regulatory protein
MSDKITDYFSSKTPLMPNNAASQAIIDNLWQFPCDFMFKAMAFSNQNAEEKIIKVIKQWITGDLKQKSTMSQKGTYTAVSITFLAESKEQLDNIYLAVNALDCVKVCL